eukprot:jgi/Mesvir1/23333/Mv21029-RA.1
MSSIKKGGYDWFEDLVNSDAGNKSVKTSKSLAPSTVVRRVDASDDEDDDEFAEREKKAAADAKAAERKEAEREEREEPVKRAYNWIVRSYDFHASRCSDGLLTVQRAYVSDRNDWFHVGRELAGYLSGHGGAMTELAPRDVLKAIDCELLADDIAEHKVALAVEFTVGRTHYAVTYPLDVPVTFPPQWVTRPGDDDEHRPAFQRGSLSSVVLSAILRDDEGRESDVTGDVVACQGPDKDFYGLAEAPQYAWAVIRYLEIKQQNRQALRLIGKRPTCGVVHPRLVVSEEGEDCLEFLSSSSPEPRRTLRIIFGDGDSVEYSNEDDKLIG